MAQTPSATCQDAVVVSLLLAWRRGKGLAAPQRRIERTPGSSDHPFPRPGRPWRVASRRPLAGRGPDPQAEPPKHQDEDRHLAEVTEGEQGPELLKIIHQNAPFARHPAGLSEVFPTAST